MERSHLVCQIVDARNPLLFRCQDIERYATEMNINKKFASSNKGLFK